MKKGLVLFLIFTMFFAGACSNTNAPAGTPKPTIIDLSAQATHSDRNTGVIIDTVSVPFEQIIKTATNVVKAECVQTIYDGTNYKHTFEIQKQYKGKIAEKQIHIDFHPGAEVCIMDKGYSYTKHNQFFPGNTYLLVLGCNRSVYREYDGYFFKEDICIPVENMSEASIYYRPLYEHIDLTKEQAKSFRKVEQYITQKCTEFSSEGHYNGADYIRSEKLSDILFQSSYVWQIEIVSLKSGRVQSGFAERYQCKILIAYKGSVQEKEIYVDFFANTVSVGEKYIVALADNILANYYQFSAKDSLIPVDQEQEVLRILQSK